MASAYSNSSSLIVPNAGCTFLVTGSGPVSVGSINGPGTVHNNGNLQATSITCGSLIIGSGAVSTPPPTGRRESRRSRRSRQNGLYRTGDYDHDRRGLRSLGECLRYAETPPQYGAGERYADYQNGSGSSTLTFTYTVQEDDLTLNLDYDNTDAIVLNGGSIVNGVGVPSNLAVPAPGQTGSLAANSDISLNFILYWDPTGVENGNAGLGYEFGGYVLALGQPDRATFGLVEWSGNAIFGACGNTPGAVYIDDYADPNGPIVVRSITFAQSGYSLVGATEDDTLRYRPTERRLKSMMARRPLPANWSMPP